ncbi:MAG: Appr-1-p processing protein [Cyanobacteria bacterium P01_D01_bin.56]
MKIINRDILTIDHGILVYQVNCQGVMGAGLAKAIADKWPVVKEEYLDWLNPDDDPSDFLGSWVLTDISPKLFVGSIFGQLNYGRSGCYTNYLSLASGLSRVYKIAQHRSLPIYLPHGIGCGLAGGDWRVVSALIEQELPDAIICKYNLTTST